VRYVLFVCNHNAGRSQMAQAFFEQLAPDDLRAESAGTEPAKQIWPVVLEAMNEVGIDLSDRVPEEAHARDAVACGRLGDHDGRGDACPHVPTTVEDWDLPDPAGRPIEEVRSIRDTIEQRARPFMTERLDEIRADRTGHELRLAQVLPTLAREFEGRRSDGEIRECADAVLSRFDDARVRAHVVTLALRQTRDCLRKPRCEVIDAS
jgi:arsenate reductase (thioredoxin)